MPMAQRAQRPTRTRPWTRSDLQRIPDDGNRYEVLDGQLLVTPQAAFSHQEIATRLLVALRGYCAGHGLGVVVGPGAVPHGKSELQPDVQVIPGSPRLSARWTQLPRPLLVVEVLSSSTRQRDLETKREAYLRWGIPEYWALDLEQRCAYVWRGEGSEPVRVSDALMWQPRADLPAFQLGLAVLFA